MVCCLLLSNICVKLVFVSTVQFSIGCMVGVGFCKFPTFDVWNASHNRVRRLTASGRLAKVRYEDRDIKILTPLLASM